MRPLAEPPLPLTHNAAERALRQHVIARRIGHGTRIPVTSRGHAPLASVIETCRLRAANVIDLLAQAIDALAAACLRLPRRLFRGCLPQ